MNADSNFWYRHGIIRFSWGHIADVLKVIQDLLLWRRCRSFLHRWGTGQVWSCSYHGIWLNVTIRLSQRSWSRSWRASVMLSQARTTTHIWATSRPPQRPSTYFKVVKIHAYSIYMNISRQLQLTSHSNFSIPVWDFCSANLESAYSA